MKIDERGIKDIEEKIRKLSESYVPEWNFDTETPDIGSAIAKIFAVQMNENIDLENSMLDRYHAEFVNMLDLSLKPAKPAGSLVKFDLIEDTIAGTYITKGTRLVADASDPERDQVIFETERDIYVTNSRIVDAFMTDRVDGSFVPLLGTYRPVSMLEGTEELTDEEELVMEEEGYEEEDSSSTGVYREIRPFVLFSETGNIARSALVMYHESLFDIEDEPIYIKLDGSSEIIDRIRNKDYVFSYYAESGFADFDSVKVLEDGITVELKKSGKCRHLTLNGRSYGVVTLQALGIVKDEEELESVGLSSSGKPRSADFVDDGSNDMDPEEFIPFTDTLSLYNECYIGQDLYFSKGGSVITLKFHVSYKERGLYLTKQEEESVLKIVKKKPKVLPSDIPADAYADEICMEYFNGLGWKKLPIEEDISGIFSKGTASDVVISFVCPNDWEETQSGAYNGRAIRLRLMKADNCFLRPGVHHYPIISGFTAEFTYEGHFVHPGKLYRIAGTEKRDITDSLKRRGRFVAMSGSRYKEDALYLGFNEPIEGGPVCIFFELDDVLNMSGLKCRYEYSGIGGFKTMKVADSTRDFSRSGGVVFIPPSDMHDMTVEGKRRRWIRICRAHAGSEDESTVFLPRIRRIMMNIVGVSNIVTGSEENFYMNEVSPNQRFPLGEGNILNADVWVNEKGSISRDEIDKMTVDTPDMIKVETDMLGGVAAVYVKWNETYNFNENCDRRSYMIDRLTGELVFSDGVKADMPKVTDDISFKVTARTTDGEAGNVGADAINATAGTELYIDTVYNPVRAYGGSNLETIPEALKRGANLIGGRGRLVSESDYIFTILGYSDSIDKAACILGETVDGTGGYADMSFVLLMKDFNEGSFSFHRIAAPLKQHLLECSPMTISPEHIFIVEPIFVSISVSVWASVKDMDDSFETQSLILQTLKDYLNPVSGDNDSGWDIGIVPKRPQILMRLGSLKSKAVITKTAMIARYTDKDGEHETDLGNLTVTPFMVVKSGKHEVFITSNETD